MCNVIPIYSSRMIGNRVVDIYPDGTGAIDIVIWRNEYRDTGWMERCATRQEFIDIIHNVEVTNYGGGAA